MNKTITILFIVICCNAFAQNAVPVDRPNYPQSYFRNPLNIPIFLAGNFGECRPGHFHSGIDIKTLGKENQPVHAAADGYISRIKMEKGGFGHGLYIMHPNGYTTLYAHLNNFAPAIQHYLKEQQYKQQKWNVDLELSPAQFPVKKGEQIAWSGNTGASTAPHLHFEIRDTKTEHPLNPELFGLPVPDKIPAVPLEVAIYNLSHSIYEQDAQLVTLRKKKNGYAPLQDTIKVPKGTLTGIGINVNDFMNGSDNTIAPYTASLYLDDKQEAEVKLDNIGYDETRYINAYTDYKTRVQRNKWIQCLFQLPGNRLDRIYEHMNSNKGALTINDDNAHKITIVITDDRSNISTVSFYLRAVIAEDMSTDKPAHLFRAGTINNFNEPNVAFSLDETELYDNIDLKFNSRPATSAFSDKYMLHYPYVPVHHYFDLSIKPNIPVPFELRDKVAMIYSDGKNETGSAASYTDQGWYKTSVRDLGTYWLVADTTAPIITSLQKNGSNLPHATQITFIVNDALTSVRKFSGELDGKWICFEQHTNRFFYKFDEHCSKGKHNLLFTATDENNNSATYHLTFTR